MVELDQDSKQRLMTMQIINFALFMGVGIFTALVLFLVYGGDNGNAARDGMPIITYVAGFMAISNAGLSVLVPSLVVKGGLERLAAEPEKTPDDAANSGEHQPRDIRSLLALRQTSLIIGLALVESFGFLGCIAFLIEQQTAALGVVGLCLFLLLVNFPTRPRLESWLDRQLNRLSDIRLRRQQSF